MEKSDGISNGRVPTARGVCHSPLVESVLMDVLLVAVSVDSRRVGEVKAVVGARGVVS